MPYDGEIEIVSKHNGDTIIPYVMAVEHLGIPVFENLIKHNATISALLHFEEFTLGMVAIGSLNVNRIHFDYDDKQYVKKGEQIGCFSL